VKKLFFVSLLALASTMAGIAGGGCSAEAEIAPYATACSNGTGRCSVFVAIGSGESSECTSTYSTATCNKYDAYGGLIVSKYVYCILVP